MLSGEIFQEIKCTNAHYNSPHMLIMTADFIPMMGLSACILVDPATVKIATCCDSLDPNLEKCQDRQTICICDINLV